LKIKISFSWLKKKKEPQGSKQMTGRIMMKHELWYNWVASHKAIKVVSFYVVFSAHHASFDLQESYCDMEFFSFIDTLVTYIHCLLA